jgi:sulfur-carrier protein
MTGVQTEVSVTVRYFAAACSAAGTQDEVLTLPPTTSVADLVNELGKRSSELALVLARCSYLCDGIAVRDPQIRLESGQTLDVLPPFAGG